MPQVETARGPVDTAALGRVLMHEHVFVLTADVQQNYPDSEMSHRLMSRPAAPRSAFTRTRPAGTARTPARILAG
jgi:predicted metal-dependent phosphotriesterase family hydrolase